MKIATEQMLKEQTVKSKQSKAKTKTKAYYKKQTTKADTKAYNYQAVERKKAIGKNRYKDK